MLTLWPPAEEGAGCPSLPCPVLERAVCPPSFEPGLSCPITCSLSDNHYAKSIIKACQLGILMFNLPHSRGAELGNLSDSSSCFSSPLRLGVQQGEPAAQSWPLLDSAGRF